MFYSWSNYLFIECTQIVTVAVAYCILFRKSNDFDGPLICLNTVSKSEGIDT